MQEVMNARASIIVAGCVLAAGLLVAPAAAQSDGGVTRGGIEVEIGRASCRERV